MGEDDYGDFPSGGMEGLKAENQRLVDLMNEALDACEDAGRPEGELLARSVKALAAEREEARSVVRGWLWRLLPQEKAYAIECYPWLGDVEEEEDE